MSLDRVKGREGEGRDKRRSISNEAEKSLSRVEMIVDYILV